MSKKSRSDLSDKEFSLIEPLVEKYFLPTGKKGRPVESQPRPLLDGMLWILSTGAPWEDMPTRYGSYKTVHRWFQRWSHDGTLQALYEALVRPEFLDTDMAAIDGTVVRAHKAAAGARKKNGSDS